MVRITWSFTTHLLSHSQVSCAYVQSVSRFPFLTSKRMFSVNLVIIVESIRAIATHKGNDTNDFFIPAVAAVATALGWLYTRPISKDQRLIHPL